MNRSTHAVMFVASLIVSGATVSAQAVRGAGAGAATAHIPALPPPAVHATAAVQGTAAAAVPRAPAMPPAGTQAAAHTSANSAVSAGIPAGASAGVAAGGAANASANGQARGLALGPQVSAAASTSLDMAETVRTIREAAFAARGTVAADVEAKVDASTKALDDLKARADAAGDKSREAFAKALVEVRAREKDLRATLRESTQVAKESSWGEIQSALAKNYGDYAQAVAQAEASVQAEGND